MRIGTSPIDSPGPHALGSLREQVRLAAQDGFASAWRSNIFGLDALTALAVAGHAGCRCWPASMPVSRATR